MLGFAIAVLLDIATGSAAKMLDAVGSFETPPRTTAAKRVRAFALVFLLIGACCGITAGILFDVNKPDPIDDVFGCAALTCMFLCVICGFRYQNCNNSTDQAFPSNDRRDNHDIHRRTRAERLGNG